MAQIGVLECCRIYGSVMSQDTLSPSTYLSPSKQAQTETTLRKCKGSDDAGMRKMGCSHTANGNWVDCLNQVEEATHIRRS